MARTLSAQVEPTSICQGRKKIECWDMEGFAPWPEIRRTLRVARTSETRTIQRQLDGKNEEQVSEWYWLTTLQREQASSKALVELGHDRWEIENHGFDETVNEWHTDHIYRHAPTAILVFTLVCLLVYNVFHAFWTGNLKPALKAKVTMRHIAPAILQEPYEGIHVHLLQPP